MTEESTFRVLGSIAVVVLLAATVMSVADDSGAPVPLTASSSRLIGVPVGSFSLPAQCDAKGDIYFYAGLANESVVFEARRDGSHFMHGLSTQDAKDYDYVSYRVDADGKIAFLVSDRSETPHLFELRDDGTSPTHTKLNAPDDMPASTVYNFIRLENGHIVVQGYAKPKAAKDGGARAYLAEYDSAGTLVRKTLEKAPGIDITQWPASTAAAQGEDGSVYILEPDKIVVLSPSGEVGREIKLAPPQPDYRPYLLYLAGQRLAVGYAKTEKSPHKLQTLYALLDASTGQPIRLYEPSPELGNSLVCFSSDGFIFYRVDHGRIKLVTAAAN